MVGTLDTPSIAYISAMDMCITLYYDVEAFIVKAHKVGVDSHKALVCILKSAIVIPKTKTRKPSAKVDDHHPLPISQRSMATIDDKHIHFRPHLPYIFIFYHHN